MEERQHSSRGASRGAVTARPQGLERWGMQARRGGGVGAGRGGGGGGASAGKGFAAGPGVIRDKGKAASSCAALVRHKNYLPDNFFFTHS